MSNSPEDSRKPERAEKPKIPTSMPTPKIRRGLKGYLAEVGREMKKVNWPSKKETNRLTFVVLTLVITIAVMLSLMGWISHVVVSLITKGQVT